MSIFSRARKGRKRYFQNFLKANHGSSRILGDWQVIDIHEIPESIGENIKISPSFGILQEFDFYCRNRKDFYLFRLRKAEKEQYSIEKSESVESFMYLIAEKDFKKITDQVILESLKVFEKIGIPKYRKGRIRLAFKNKDV